MKSLPLYTTNISKSVFRNQPCNSYYIRSIRYPLSLFHKIGSRTFYQNSFTSQQRSTGTILNSPSPVSKPSEVLMELMDDDYEETMFSTLSDQIDYAPNKHIKGWASHLIHQNGSMESADLQRGLLHKFGLKASDLRILISTVNFPTLVSRHKSILFDFRQIQAIILPDKVYLFKNNTDMPDRLAKVLVKRIRNDRNKPSIYSDVNPFEFVMLDSFLEFIIQDAEKEYFQLVKQISKLLNEEKYVPSEIRLHGLLVMKQTLSRFATSIKELNSTIMNLLSNDEDMARLYISSLREESDHEEIEILLESYYTQLESIEYRIRELQGDVQSTQDYMNICLDSARNRMMKLDLVITILTFSFAVGSFVAAVFGMNLLSGYEERAKMFNRVIICIGGIIVMTSLGLYAHSIRRNIFRSHLSALQSKQKRKRTSDLPTKEL